MAKRILVVEDDPVILEAVVYNLETEGYKVDTASDGTDGLEAARKLRPDIVLLDIMLPNMSGLDVCRLLKDELDQPVILMTARDAEIDVLNGFDCGADDYITKPFIVGMAEEIIGGPARLQQSDAHIRRHLPEEPTKYGFHRGINPAYDHRDKGLYHFTFIKALTNLTDLGPDDGGTTVIAGTHKVPTDVPQEAIIAAAMDAPSMIHQVEAPAGSTLLFYESLIHAAGIIKSDKDRLLILAGYVPTMFQAWMDYDPDPDFAQTLSDEHRALITGEQKFHWPRNPRDLGVPAATV